MGIKSSFPPLTWGIRSTAVTGCLLLQCQVHLEGGVASLLTAAHHHDQPAFFASQPGQPSSRPPPNTVKVPWDVPRVVVEPKLGSTHVGLDRFRPTRVFSLIVEPSSVDHPGLGTILIGYGMGRYVERGTCRSLFRFTLFIKLFQRVRPEVRRPQRLCSTQDRNIYESRMYL